MNPSILKGSLALGAATLLAASLTETRSRGSSLPPSAGDATAHPGYRPDRESHPASGRAVSVSRLRVAGRSNIARDLGIKSGVAAEAGSRQARPLWCCPK